MKTFNLLYHTKRFLLLHQVVENLYHSKSFYGRIFIYTVEPYAVVGSPGRIPIWIRLQIRPTFKMKKVLKMLEFEKEMKIEQQEMEKQGNWGYGTRLYFG